MTFHRLGISSSQLTKKNIFQRGRFNMVQPPIRYKWAILHGHFLNYRRIFITLGPLAGVMLPVTFALSRLRDVAER